MKSGTFFLNRIRQVYEREKLQQPHRQIPVVQSKLADEAAVKDAMSLIMQEILDFKV